MLEVRPSSTLVHTSSHSQVILRATHEERLCVGAQTPPPTAAGHARLIACPPTTHSGSIFGKGGPMPQLRASSLPHVFFATVMA